MQFSPLTSKRMNTQVGFVLNLYNSCVTLSLISGCPFVDEEIERMRLRPGIERALDVEHRKALRKVGIEMNKIKLRDSENNNRRQGEPRAGSMR